MAVTTHAGTFSSPTSTGHQTISTGLGSGPDVVIIWSTRQGATGWTTENVFALGFCAATGGGATAGYIAFDGENGVSGTEEERRFNYGTGTAPTIGLVKYDGTLLAEATLYSVGSGNFTLNWTTAYTYSDTFNYLAITGLSGYKVVEWTANTTTGNQSITGVGFQPEGVIHIGIETTYAAPHSGTDTLYNIGAMDANGNEWSKYGFAKSGWATSYTGRIQLTDSCIVGTAASSSVAYKASFVSMDADGFTLDWGTADGNARNFISLCIGGGVCEVGSFAPTAWVGGTQTIPLPSGVTPVGIVSANDSYPTITTEVAGHRLFVGASDGTNTVSAGCTDKNGVTTTVCYRNLTAAADIVVANNDVETTDYSGQSGGFASGSFNVVWNTTPSAATQVCYIAFCNWTGIAGVTATASINAYVPSISVTAPGKTATSTLSANVAAISGSTVDGLTSSAVINANVPTIDVSVPGVTATSVISAGVGLLGGDVQVQGITATAALTAGVGGIIQSVEVPGVTATAAITAYVANAGGLTAQVVYDVWPSSGTTITNDGLAGSDYDGAAYQNDYIAGGPYTAWAFTNNPTDVVTIPAGPIVDDLTNLTLVFGVYYAGPSSGETCMLFNKPTDTGGSFSVYIVPTYNNSPCNSVVVTRYTQDGNYDTWSTPANSVAPFNWYDIAVVWQCATGPGDPLYQTPIIYINNVPFDFPDETLTQVSVGTGLWDTDDSGNISLGNDAFENNFNGEFAVFRLYTTTTTGTVASAYADDLPIFLTPWPITVSGVTADSVLSANVANIIDGSSVAVPGITATAGISANVAEIISEQQGVGVLWFGGVNISDPPYYAHLADATKYWWLDGFDSMQFTTSPLSTISTRPYLKDWVISTVIRPKVPDNKRTTMIAAMMALGEVFDPTQGEQQLIFGEYPASYFMAKRQKSNPANENVTPTLLDLDIDFACTGPAYSTTESVVWNTVTGTITTFTIDCGGDTLAWPLWSLYAGGGQTVGITITNETTNESITWTGSLGEFGAVLEFSMDPEYGTPYTIFLNGEQSLESFMGPAWPHLAPGENTILVQTTVPLNALLITTWRDRFLVGQQVAPEPTTPSAILPTYATINGQDCQKIPTCPTGTYPTTWGSYVFSGQVRDVFGNALEGATVYLYNSGNRANWSISGGQGGFPLAPVTTDSNGNYKFPATSWINKTRYFQVRVSPLDGYLACNSNVITAIPIATRLGLTLTISADASNTPEYVFSGSLMNGSTPVANTPIYLDILVTGGVWTTVPGVAPAITDSNGDYSFTYTVGPTELPGVSNETTWPFVWPLYFSVTAPGNLQFNTAEPKTALTITGQSTPWPEQTPGEITYIIGVPADLIVADGGALMQYFAACGFTVCIVEVDSNASTDNIYYAEHLAIIQSLGMKGVLDIEFMNAGYAASPSWWQTVTALGWDCVSSECGNTTTMAYCRKYVPCYINYTPVFLPTASYCGTPASGKQYYYQAVNGYATCNSLEAYYGTDDESYIEATAIQSAEIGVPCGILAYVGGASFNSTYNDSLQGVAPDYKTYLDWSYANGVGMTNFTAWIPTASTPLSGAGPMEYNILYYLSCGFDQIVEELQSSYPPAGTDALAPITMIMPDVTIDLINEGSPYAFSFTGVLSELLSGNPIVGGEVYLQVSSNLGNTWTNATIPSGAAPAITGEEGIWNSNTATFAPGFYFYRAYFPGDATHPPMYSSYDNPPYYDYFTINGTGTTTPTLTLTASTTTPTVGQVITWTVTLTGVSGAPIASENITITAENSIATGFNSIGFTNSSGQYTTTASWGSTGGRSYWASYAGDNTYAPAESNVVNISVEALSEKEREQSKKDMKKSLNKWGPERWS